MIAALVYLQLTSLKNSLLEKLKRLKKPRYLAGFVVGLAYFYYFVFRYAFERQNALAHDLGPAGFSVSEWMPLAEPIAALIGLIILSFAWIVPHSRSALKFTEAEIAFLFPAPLTRTTLIHYKLIKSQLPILISALIFCLFSRKAPFMTGGTASHMLGWWILLFTINLHFYASSFTCERLANRGLRVWQRQLLCYGFLILLLGFAVVWTIRTIPAALPGREYEILPWVQRFFSAPLLDWVLSPFRLALKPFFAQDATAFWLAIGPALLLLVLHYFWLIRSQVAFEEAALDSARKTAEILARMRAGGNISGKQERHDDPFALRPQGPLVTAFLWKGLIVAGRWGKPRTWLILAAILSAVVFLVTRDPSLSFARAMVSTISMTLVIMLLFLLPMMSQRGLPQLMERMDVVKAYPLRGWQAVLGEMLTPILLFSVVEWSLLLLIAICGMPGMKAPAAIQMLTGPGLLGVALLIPLLLAIVLTLPFGAALLFPAWVSTANQQGAGIEVMGQRMLFSAGYMLALVLSLVPATLLGAVPYLIVYLLSDSHLAAFYSAVVVANLMLATEFGLLLWWMGERYEKFDLSSESTT